MLGVLTLWKGARHLDPEIWENSAGRPNRGLWLSTATGRQTLPQHLRLAKAVMWIPQHLTVVPSEGLFRCGVLLVGLNAGSRDSWNSSD